VAVADGGTGAVWGLAVDAGADWGDDEFACAGGEVERTGSILGRVGEVA